MSDTSRALDTGNQFFLCRSGFGRDKYRVVTADVADHFRPVAAIECERDTLCRADGGSNHQQIRAGRAYFPQQGGDLGYLPVAGLVSAR